MMKLTHFNDNTIPCVWKHLPEDFIVEEITQKYGKLSINKDYSFKSNNSKGEHLVCVFKKRNVETFFMIKHLSKLLHVSPDRISLAGVKDKRAYTVQLGSIYKVSHNKVLKIKEHFKGYDVMPIEYSDKKVYLGDLIGNAFTITLRNISEYDVKRFKDVLENYYKRYDHYFPNYYGSQRFGKNVTLGKYLLRRDFEGFLRSYLDIPSLDQEVLIKIRTKRGYHERNIINYLLSHSGKDYLGAIKTLPKSLLKMMVHSYQSYVFNMVLSQCISEKCVDWNGLVEREIHIPGSDYEGFAFRDYFMDKAIEFFEIDGVSFKDFNFPEFNFSCGGLVRKCVEKVKNFKYWVKNDEIFQDKYKIVLYFELNKGSYASVFLEEFFDFS